MEGEHGPVGPHVRLRSAEVSNRVEPHHAPTPVEGHRPDRDRRFAGDAPEARLPPFDPTAGAFGGDGQEEGLVPERGHRGLHYPVRRLAVHGDAAQPPHEPPEGRPEQRVLTQEAEAEAQGQGGEDPHDEVPVRGVGGDHDHDLGPVGHLALEAPAQEANAESPQAARQGVAPAGHVGTEGGHLDHGANPLTTRPRLIQGPVLTGRLRRVYLHVSASSSRGRSDRLAAAGTCTATAG
jgi:hypothetical protein